MASARPRRKAAARPVIRTAALLGFQKIDLFRGLDAASLGEIAAQCEWTRCKRNQYLVRRDGTNRDVYFVVAGMVRVAAATGRGRRIIFRDIPAGELFGELSAIDGRGSYADVFAVRESLLASMSAEAFRAILARHAAVRERLLRRLGSSVRELADRLLDLGARSVQWRVWVELLRLARAAGVQAGAARIEGAPTHREMASRVGTSREEVTRELSRLARRGLIERSARALVLRDVAALETLVADSRLDEGQAPGAAEDAAQGPSLHGTRRQRRAVLVADVLERMSLDENDEERALELWRAFFAHATAEVIPSHAGRSLSRVIGDGFLAEFADPSQAVRCAFELQRSLAQFGIAPDTPLFGMRIGIHLAEVIVETINLLGDGVNVAARLAELASPGETIVSVQVRDQLSRGVDCSIEDLGEQRLRNRERAVRAFRVWPLAPAAPRAPSVAARAHGRPSVAVIPFRLRSEDARFAFIGDGLADEIIGALSTVADLFVVSRLSSMAFRAAPLGVRRIGEMLGVQYVLSGSVQTAHPRALLMAELADARDGSILWSERFEGDLADVFAMQADLARKVVAHVAPFLRSLELRRARITSFEQLDAYGITLRGVELMHRLSREDFLQARVAFETAIARDPVSPAPHAWLANWHVLCVSLGATGNAAAELAAATASAGRALACDPHHALALAVDAHVAAWAKHDLDAAETRLTQALAANPNEPLAWLWSALTHSWRGRGGEAVACAGRALSLSPLDPMIYYFESLAGQANLIDGQYERAIELLNRSLRQNSSHTSTWRTLAAALVFSGRLAEARETMYRMRELEPELTVTAWQKRYPGRDSGHAAEFAGALLAAGMPP